MLVQLNNGKIISLDAVSSIDVKGTKLYYRLNNNELSIEVFETSEEVKDRIEELFNFNYELDESSFNKALNTANDILGE